MLRLVRLILYLKWKSLKIELQYPGNFLLQVLGIGSMGLLYIIEIWLLTRAFPSVGGWDFWQLGFMTGLFQMALGVYHALFIYFGWHSDLVVEGTYDRILIRPVHPILQIMTGRLHLAALGEFLPGIVLFALTSSRVNIQWNFFNGLFLVLIIFSGAVIQWAVTLVIAAFDFWFVRTALFEIINPFQDFLTRYPIHIYPPLFRFLMTFILPFAFIAYYPTHYFFQREVAMFNPSFAYLTPLVALLMAALAVAFWTWGLKSYQSTGT